MPEEAKTDVAARAQSMWNELQERRNPGANGYSGSVEMLERVREYEQQNVQFGTPAIASAKNDEIERLALLDGLTELYNFRSFIKELKAELGRAKRYKHPVAMIMIVIDGFEELCDQYGALTGEAVLKVIANVLRSAVREVDIPCKYSAQHFAVILPQTNSAGAALVAERIRQRIGNQAISHNWQSFSVTASLGVAAYPAHAQEYDELIARSMEALDYASERGGDRVLSA
jgi:diguanylate cyclase (GGDEF)-like protein